MFLLGPIPEDTPGALRWAHAHVDYFLNPTSGVPQAEAKALAASIVTLEASLAAEADALAELRAAEKRVEETRAALEALEREHRAGEAWRDGVPPDED